MSVSIYNPERYVDPTPYEALRSEGIPAWHPSGYPRTYISSPFRGDTDTNVRNAIRYSRYALEQGRFPITPHIFLPRFLDDEDHNERRLALSFGIRLLDGCREMWVFGDNVSEGMAAEIKEAKRRNIPLKYFTNDCKERIQ